MCTFFFTRDVFSAFVESSAAHESVSRCRAAVSIEMAIIESIEESQQYTDGGTSCILSS